MSVIDKAIAAVTPPESEKARAEATRKAEALAGSGDWLAMALDHHRQIRAAFTAAEEADPVLRVAAMQELALILVGHAQAEEIVLYPALAKADKKSHAMMGYTEQTAVKMQMAELERLDPASEEWTDKLGHIRGAVLHHMFEEEGDWFIELKENAEDQDMLTKRFAEEFSRYVT
jgi:hypothetical protein